MTTTASGTTLEVDFGKVARVYARFRPPFPKVLFERLYELGMGIAGQRVLDLGTGTGVLAREFAGRSCLVTGLDKSAPLIQEAIRLDDEHGTEVRYIQAPAEDTGLPDRTFHVVTSCQSWGWFDRAAAAAEAMRLLRPDGIAALISYDWLPLPGSVCAATEELIAAANPHWMLGGGSGLHPDWTLDLHTAGFVDIETFSFDVEVPFSREAWRGRARASSGIAASLDAEATARFDDSLRLMLEDRFPAEPVKVMHRLFVCAGRRPAGGEDLAHEVR